jgi:hypothetical protein
MVALLVLSSVMSNSQAKQPRTILGSPARVIELNNTASELLSRKDFDGAARILDRTAKILDTRPAATADPANLEPAMDEYFYRCHRAVLGWHRKDYVTALPHAERAYALEREIFAAGRAAGKHTLAELAPFALSTGAWSYISHLTANTHYAQAHRVFAAVVDDREFLEARRLRDTAAVEKILLAGVCVYFEDKSPASFGNGRDTVAKAQRALTPSDPELAYAYACFWARLADGARAIDALALALRNGVGPERAFEDPDFLPWHSDPRFVALVVEPLLTWKLDSLPAGARVFLDGKDTGQKTPARMLPAKPGDHEIRFVLDGHRDQKYPIKQTKGAGLSLNVALESLTLLAEQKKMALDSAWKPDQATRERTLAFLGPHPQWRQAVITVSRGATYGKGPEFITVRGDGEATWSQTDFAPPHRERKKVVTLEVDAVSRLFEAFVAEAFTEIVIAPHTSLPDEPLFTVELCNARGKKKILQKGSGTEHQRFNRLVALVRKTVVSP